MSNAKRISDEAWRMHQPEITRLLGFMIMEDVVETMRTCFDFDANPRQLGYRSNDKWGNKKNRSTKRLGNGGMNPSPPEDAFNPDALKHMFPQDEFYLAVGDSGRAFPLYMGRLKQIKAGLYRLMDVLISCARACKTKEDALLLSRYIEDALEKTEGRDNAESHHHLLHSIKYYILCQSGLPHEAASEATIQGLAGLGGPNSFPAPWTPRAALWNMPASVMVLCGLKAHHKWARTGEKFLDQQYKHMKLKNLSPATSSKSTYLETIRAFLGWCITELGDDAVGQSLTPCDVLSAACPEEPGDNTECIVWRAFIYIACLLYGRWVAQAVAHAPSRGPTPVDWAKKTMRGLLVSTSDFIATMSSILVGWGRCEQFEPLLHAHAGGTQAYCQHGTLASLARRNAESLQGEGKFELLELFFSRYLCLAMRRPSAPGTQEFIDTVHKRAAAFKEKLDVGVLVRE